ncbi:hypothetical protein O9K51_03286 [Purpureocillium lavendulum]|uniref:Uncharacterized protein n=1 Tax=Purpureocillium lavendulum TaxID=1247861 RepID=A0AB34G3Q2_9HYPO|nr:hypothetical protein O9K51_03286 [Purpureocillium lavendulum]
MPKVRIIEHKPSSSDGIASSMTSSYSSSGLSTSSAVSYGSTASTAPTSLTKTRSSSRSTRYERPRRRSQESSRTRGQHQESRKQDESDEEGRDEPEETEEPSPPTITFFPPSPSASLSSVATYDSLLSDAEPDPLSLSPEDATAHDGSNNGDSAEASTVHLPSPADACIPAALPPYRTLIPIDPSLRPSDPYTFARLFPSLDRLAVRHDDATPDGNMNLRVETVVAPAIGNGHSASGVGSGPGPVLGARRRPATVQLFHLRMHDLARRDFSLRRYCRDSGREVCFSKRAYAPSGVGTSSSATNTFQRALRSVVKGPFRRSSSSSSASSASGAANGDASAAASPRNSLAFPRRPSTGGSTATTHTASSSCWSRRGSTASSASLSGKPLSGVAAGAAAHPPPQVLVPTDTIKLDGGGNGSMSGATKAYEFEWWGHRYAWRRAVDRALGTVSFHLVRDGDEAAAVAHVVPEVRTPTQVYAEDRAGGWVPPCYMWISDPSVVDAMTDVADIIVATGLIALVDDSIRERWPLKKQAHVPPGNCVTMSDRPPQINYTVDPSTNPATWPGPVPTSGHHVDVSKVDVIYINVNGASDFTVLRTGTNEHVHHALTQVTKHIARGLYRVVSVNASEYSCVVVMSTEKPRDELMWKNGFPWDREADPQSEVVLK